MSPQVEKMFSVRESYWWKDTEYDHGQGEILGDHPSWEDARIAAGLGWDPVEGPLFRSPDYLAMRERFAKIMLDAELTTTGQLDQLAIAVAQLLPQVGGWKHVGRDDDDEITLACTKDTYKVIPNSEFGHIFEALMKVPNVKYETGGCLDDGRLVWMLALLDEPLEIGGDKGTVTYPYISLMSRHDARGATTLRATNVRVVCKNTFEYAEMLGEKNKAEFSFIHRGEWQKQLEDARAAVMGVQTAAQQYKELSEYLLTVPVSDEQRELFISEMFRMPTRAAASDRVRGNVEESRAAFRDLMNGPTVAGSDIQGTAYGVIQAAGEYLDHIVTAKSWETKIGRTLLKPNRAKAKALTLLSEVVGFDIKKNEVTEQYSEGGLLVA